MFTKGMCWLKWFVLARLIEDEIGEYLILLLMGVCLDGDAMGLSLLLPGVCVSV